MRFQGIILADSAQSVDGKIYLLGGGWTNLKVKKVPAVNVIGVAALLEIDAEEEADSHIVEFAFKSAAGADVGQARVELEHVDGTEVTSRVGIAFNLPLRFAEGGPHSAVALVDGVEAASTDFTVVLEDD